MKLELGTIDIIAGLNDNRPGRYVYEYREETDAMSSSTQHFLRPSMKQGMQQWHGTRLSAGASAAVILGEPPDAVRKHIEQADERTYSVDVVRRTIAHSHGSPKLLVVDGRSDNIRALRGAFEGDFQVIGAVTAEQALAFAGAAEKPDLILLDIMGPSNQGFDICRLLKRNQQTARIPVIFMVPRGDEEDEIAGLALGAVDFILKPFHMPLVKARINNHLNLKCKTDLLEQQAHLDGLTHIPNRRRFDITLEQEWRRTVRGEGTLALLMIDLDEFKPYNDLYGHGVGDTCLRAVAGTLTSCARRPTDLVARYGGEEFVALLPDSNQESAETVARRMQQAVARQSISHAGSSIADHVTISVGCAIVQPKLGENPNYLIDLADWNLYEAKSRGKNCVYAGVFQADSSKD